VRKTVIAAVGLLFLGAVPNTFLGQSVATVEGVVREIGTNRPLAGVSIGVTSTGVVPVAYVPAEQRNAPGLAVTDAEGRFLVTLNEIGRVRVVTRIDGFIFTRPGQARAPAQPGVWVQTRAGGRGIELWMTRPATINGRLLDSQGQHRRKCR
jgi:hypothetical protein